MSVDRATDFGTKLREARERRGVSLRTIADATKISVAVLEALERNDVSPLPAASPPASTTAPAKPAASPPAAAKTDPATDEGLTIVLSARRKCYVSATVDGRKAIEQSLTETDHRTLEVRKEMVLTVGDA